MKKKVSETELKALRDMDLKQQLLFVESYLPDAYEYLTDAGKLPTFDDNDEVVSWGHTPQDIPHDVDKKEDKNHESIS